MEVLLKTIQELFCELNKNLEGENDSSFDAFFIEDEN